MAGEWRQSSGDAAKRPSRKIGHHYEQWKYDGVAIGGVACLSMGLSIDLKGMRLASM